jgi:hypothetical protein
MSESEKKENINQVMSIVIPSILIAMASLFIGYYYFEITGNKEASILSGSVIALTLFLLVFSNDFIPSLILKISENRNAGFNGHQLQINSVKSVLGVLLLVGSFFLGFKSELYNYSLILMVISVSLINEAHESEILLNKKLKIGDYFTILIFGILTFFYVRFPLPDTVREETAGYIVYQSLLISASFTSLNIISTFV